jgi:hypothetical protein
MDAQKFLLGDLGHSRSAVSHASVGGSPENFVRNVSYPLEVLARFGDIGEAGRLRGLWAIWFTTFE